MINKGIIKQRSYIRINTTKPLHIASIPLILESNGPHLLLPLLIFLDLIIETKSLEPLPSQIDLLLVVLITLYILLILIKDYFRSALSTVPT